MTHFPTTLQSSPRTIGQRWFVVTLAAYVYIAVWVLVLPFVPEDVLLHRAFPPVEYIFMAWSCVGIALIAITGTFIGVVFASA
mmetsp:Transcript_10741/g.30150  ORF Transcript_10741/g.30150 Transcript_10741/m.30150 type:complete len:83 (+) Transcript_10741:87-335(+)|eukprot:CAMPEP_0119123186 /NCGR_PEP_ID=MMETSP1310-20130426/3208_1 /TAXON_ID=464262 /ORGANISM="Genus nov. species nov., Strain RCC2339" /LENGTH=82 /DNA_ID=CAMNT_0007112951 /DNA_START=86 /DNA_END=334 /DNA_ORIENTATION=+